MNGGTAWVSGIPLWLNDANLSVNTNIVGATYRATWQALYSTRNILLNAITARAKTLADAAQAAAAAAQATANVKRRVFVATPVTPYEIGDLWVEGATGDIRRCNVTRLTGAFTAADWGLASRYTDDTVATLAQNAANTAQSAANAAQTTANTAQTTANTASTNATNALTQLTNITSDSVLSIDEKPGQRMAWNIVSEEKAGINTQAANYAITGENTNYNNAFQALATYLNGGTAWVSGIPLWLNDANLSVNTTIVGATYRATWEALYSTRNILLNAITARAKTLADAAQSAANAAQAAAAAAQVTANSADYLKQALQGSTDIDGGLQATNVLLMKTIAGIITGGMSGLATDNIGIWTGGTYQNAIDSVANIILRKDGSGQLAGGKILWDILGALFVGKFQILAGNIVGKDLTGSERLNISIDNIPAITSIGSSFIIATNEMTGSSSFLAELVWDPYLGFFTQLSGNTINVISVQVVLPYATFINVQAAEVGFSFSHPENIAHHAAWQSVTVRNSVGTTVATGQVNQNIQIAAAGTYTVELTTNADATIVNNQIEAHSHVSFFINNTFVKYVESVEKTALGKDGLFSYFSSSEYIHFKRGEGFKMRGKTDMPGILAAASVASAGGSSRKFGAKVGTSLRLSAGTYRINHSIGHGNYSVQVTPQTSSRLSFVSTRANTTCTIVITNTAGTAIDSPFEYLLIGEN